MALLHWDESGQRLYETGVDKVVLYPMLANNEYGKGIAWNGVTGVTENPEGAEANDIYADNIKYLSLISAENWKASLKAYNSPIEFAPMQGEIEFNNNLTLTSSVRGVFFGQQKRKKFAISWRSLVGNDSLGDAYAYKIHIAYGLSAAPSERDHATVNDSPEATEFSWELSSIPVAVNTQFYIGGESKTIKPVSHIVFNSYDNDTIIQKLENILWGSVSADATCPLPDALIRDLKL